MSTHYIQASTNGRLHAADEPSLSPLNRGYLYGDAIYEVWRTYHGVVFAWDEHWQRLLRSAAALHMDLPFTPAQIFTEIRHATEAYRAHTRDAGELYIRLQVTRGSGAIGLDTALADRTDFVLLVQPCPETSAEKLRDGLRLSLSTGLRRNPIESLNPAWKTGNYLNNILCLREARTRGADEVVMLNHDGEVTEAAVSNIGFVRGGKVLTPPLAAGILGGITRGFLLRPIAVAAGVTAREESLRPADFAACEECFLLSSTKDITPVAAIDGARFRVGADTVTTRLKTAFANFTRSYAAAHPQQRL